MIMIKSFDNLLAVLSLASYVIILGQALLSELTKTRGLTTDYSPIGCFLLGPKRNHRFWMTLRQS